MNQNEAVLQFAERIDAATNKQAEGITEIAKDIAMLRTQIAEQGITKDTLTRLDSIAARAEQRAADLEQLGKVVEDESATGGEDQGNTGDQGQSDAGTDTGNGAGAGDQGTDNQTNEQTGNGGEEGERGAA